MMRGKISRRDERGAMLVELAIAGTVFFIVLFSILEFSRMMWTHNALANATRDGARWASINAQNAANVQNVVVYGTPGPAAGAKPAVYGMTTSNVDVVYSTGVTIPETFGVKNGTVRVRITGYQFKFSVPFLSATLTMPDYVAVATGESAGILPPVI